MRMGTRRFGAGVVLALSLTGCVEPTYEAATVDASTQPYSMAHYLPLNGEETTWPETGGPSCTLLDLLLEAGSRTEPEYSQAVECDRPVKGTWIDTYSGVTVTDGEQMTADFVYPLPVAHEQGVKTWSAHARLDFATQDRNLVLVTKESRKARANRDITEWQPAPEFRCDFGTRYEEVARGAGLKLSDAQIRAVNDLKRSCK